MKDELILLDKLKLACMLLYFSLPHEMRGGMVVNRNTRPNRRSGSVRGSDREWTTSGRGEERERETRSCREGRDSDCERDRDGRGRRITRTR